MSTTERFPTELVAENAMLRARLAEYEAALDLTRSSKGQASLARPVDGAEEQYGEYSPQRSDCVHLPLVPSVPAISYTAVGNPVRRILHGSPQVELILGCQAA